jgi:hypothetical protein
MLNKYNFYISSSQRTLGTPSNFNIKLNTDITLSKNVNSQFRIYVHSATIPFSFNQWNSNNYTTYFNLNQGGRDYPGSFIIPAGNYNINTFATAWIASLETQLGVLVAYFPNITYTYNSDTNKLTFVLPFDGTGSIITFYNNTGYTYVNLALGFTAQWTLTEGSTAISTQQCNISPARNLYLYSNSMSSPNNYEALTSQMSTSTQICSIPINVTPNNYIIYTPFNRLVSTVSNKSFSNLNFQLQSEDLDVNLSNFTLNWSMVFCIEEWRVEDPIQSLVQMNIDNKKEILQEGLQRLNNLKQEVLGSLQTLKQNEIDKIKSLQDTKDETQSDENRITKKDRREKGFVSTITPGGTKPSKTGNDSNTPN